MYSPWAFASKKQPETALKECLGDPAICGGLSQPADLMILSRCAPAIETNSEAKKGVRLPNPHLEIFACPKPSPGYTDPMNEAQVTVSSAFQPWWKIPLRVLIILLFAAIIGWTLNLIEVSMESSAQPAGFSRGIIQGALMPMSMPNLLVGKDVTIYSQNNTGLTYKLGYTAGVNSCGAIFFGFFFWRVRRWKRNGKREA